jgi:uncharacterized membrane protein
LTAGPRKRVRLLPTLVRGLLLSAGVLPWLVDELSGVFVLHHVSEAVDSWFAMQCHREPERSLWLHSRQLPVCARCLGIYSGLGLGALLMRPRLSAAWLRLCVGVALLLMVLDVLTEALAMRPESALLRFATGLLLAWPISVELCALAQRRQREGSA